METVEQVLLRGIRIRFLEKVSVHFCTAAIGYLLRIPIKIDDPGIPDIFRIILSELCPDDLQVGISEVIDIIRFI